MSDPNAPTPIADALAGIAARKAASIDRRSFMKAAGAAALAAPFLGCKPAGTDLSGTAVIVGAGLSGLATAMLLEERGIKVTILEGRDRLGGRVMVAVASCMLAMMILALAFLGRTQPTGMYSPLSSNRSSFFWTSRVRSPISSRKSVPPSAAEK